MYYYYTVEPGVVSSLIQGGTDIQMINITWQVPTEPNGVIIMYEIRYRESNKNVPYNMTNTTNTQYNIGELHSYTNYTIGVRAYTNVGPGEWINKQFNTIYLPGKQFNIVYTLST